MKKLSYATLEEQGYEGYLLKEAPERVLQFGEGNFLRAFVDYFIDKKPVFSHGSEHIFKFLDRSVAFDFMEDGYRDKVGIMPLLLGLAYNTARGMIAMRAVGTALVSFPIPIINPTEALKRAGKQQ